VNLNNYAFLFTDSLYINAFLTRSRSRSSPRSCVCSSAIRSPTASRAPPRPRANILLLLVVLPFWTSLLLRVYAWIGIAQANGVINNVLLWLGVIHEPITMLYTPFAMYVGIVIRICRS